MRNEAPLGIPCKICWATMFHKLFQILLYFTYFLEVQIKEEKLKFSDACYVEQMIRPKRSDKYLYFFECRITSINVVNFHIREKVSEKKNQNLIFCVETLLSECKQLCFYNMSICGKPGHTYCFFHHCVEEKKNDVQFSILLIFCEKNQND